MHPGRLTSAAVAALTALTLTAVAGCGSKPHSRAVGPLPGATASPSTSASAAPAIPPAASPPADLPVIDYYRAPVGLPADPAPDAAEPLAEGVRPTSQVAVYDAPGGQPRAYLTSVMNGVPVTVPVVTRQVGWTAVLLPTVNRTVGWLPPDGWTSTPLHDHVVLHRATRELSWYRDGVLQRSWTVAIGAPATQTPLGRTFVLARSPVHGSVYGGLDALALGAVPDNPANVATGLSGAHIGIHSWYRDVWGQSISNGCVRVPKDAQQTLLAELEPGSEVIVAE